MNMKRVLAAILVISWAGKLIASPISDLNSPSPETRAATAKILRATYTPPSRTNWDSLVATLRIGDKKTNIEQHLSTLNVKPGPGSGEQLLSVEYRLDEGWLLKCSYRYQGQYRNNEVLYDRNLQFSPIYFPVKAPTNFTGVWIEYYINGQKCLETNMKDGLRHGDLTCYKFDGSKAYVEHH